MKKKDSLEELNSLDYPVKIAYDHEDSLFVADFFDLPGCSATGSTVAEAYDRAQEAKVEWLRLTSELGLPIPKPSKAAEYSGRVLLRLPVSLHATLADKARINNVSLNQYLVHLLSAGAAGDQVNNQIETMNGCLQRIESHIIAVSARQQGGSTRGGIEQSQTSGMYRLSSAQFGASRPNPGSAFESASIT